MKLPAIAAIGALLAACGSAPPEPGKVERLPAEALARLAPQPAAALSLDDIVAQSKAGTPPGEIVERLRRSGTRDRLTAAGIVALHDAGVADAVIDAMLAGERQALLDDAAAEFNRREARHAEDMDRLEREWSLRCNLACGPWEPWPGPWGYGRRW